MNIKDSKHYNIIKKQIEREPEGMVEVSVKCPFGYPAVIKVYPFFKKRVFPTTYWLTCPYLNKEISIIEEQGWIEKIQKQINNNKVLKDKLEKLHKKYAKKRMEMLKKVEINEIKEISLDILYTLKESGIGGIKEKKGIKCLHTHTADYLVNNENPVGKIIFEKIGWPEKCSICKELKKDD
ncbi:MAG TPA: DUF501 domain-containing protein [Halanaerobiales bacterium]|nr:DUF501 domain-containing protein [Halanaerobiales bacterium]